MENTSYWLPDGRLIFAYKYNKRKSREQYLWRIYARSFVNKNGYYSLVWFREAGEVSYKTKYDCVKALHEYAREHHLKPAY